MSFGAITSLDDYIPGCGSVTHIAPVHEVIGLESMHGRIVAWT